MHIPESDSNKEYFGDDTLEFLFDFFVMFCGEGLIVDIRNSK